MFDTINKAPTNEHDIEIQKLEVEKFHAFADILRTLPEDTRICALLKFLQ